MKKIFLLLISAFMVFSLTACPKQEETPALAIIYGYHSNARIMDLTQPKIIENELTYVAQNAGYVNFINCDGSPVVYYQKEIDEIDMMKDKGIETSKRLEELEKALLDEEKCCATHEEVNTLAAIAKAANVLSDVEGSKSLLIADTGLATTGYLKFGDSTQSGRIDLREESTEIWDAYCQKVVESLEKEKALPDLTGVSVTWLYLGQVGDPQEELNEIQKANLETIWNTVLTAAGAESVKFRNDDATNEVYSGLPSVSTVQPGGTTTGPFSEITFDENSAVSFKGDSAEFKYPEKAEAAIEEVADKLQSEDYSLCKICIVGTTAGCKDKIKYKALAVERAEKVKRILTEDYGIDEDRMTTYGYAAEDAPNGWYQDDLDENGEQIQKIACENRAVHIVDANSEEAHNLT